MRLRGTGTDGDIDSRRGLLLPGRTAQRTSRSQHPFLEVVADFRFDNRALESTGRGRAPSVIRIRVDLCLVVRDGVVQQCGAAGAGNECRHYFESVEHFPTLAGSAVPPAGHSWVLVCANLRLAITGLQLGTTRALFVGYVATTGHRRCREDCLPHFLFRWHVVTGLRCGYGRRYAL